MGTDTLTGKVGRIYMPKQAVDTMATSKYKGAKRERRAEAADRKTTRQSAADKGAAPAAKKPRVAAP